MVIYLPRHLGDAEHPQNAVAPATIERARGWTVLVLDDAFRRAFVLSIWLALVLW